MSNFLYQVTSTSNYCNWQLESASTVTPIDVGGVTTTHPSSTELNIPKIYNGPNTTSPVVFENGQYIPYLVNKIKAGRIKFGNILSTGFPNEFQGELVFSIDPSSVERSVKPISIPIVFRVKPSDPINAKRINQCCFGSTCPPPPTTAMVSIFCHAGNNSSNTCTKNVYNELNLSAYGISKEHVNIRSCRVTSHFDDGHQWGGGHPYNSLSYDPVTTDVSLSVNQAGVNINLVIDYDVNSVAGVANSFSCSY